MTVKKFITGPVQANTYLVYDETKDGFVVDPGAYNAQLNQMIEQEGINLKYIVLTHGHADHIGGVESVLKLCPDAKIIAHRLEEEMLTKPELNISVEIYGKPIVIKTDIFVDDMDSVKCIHRGILLEECASFVTDVSSVEIHCSGHQSAERTLRADPSHRLLNP